MAAIFLTRFGSNSLRQARFGFRVHAVLIGLALLSVVTAARAQNKPADGLFHLSADQPGELRFTGPKTAELFTREVGESFKGVLEKSYVSLPGGKLPPGFVNASPPPQGWAGTMWTRDAGAILREMVAWGYYQHAGQTARCLMDLVGTNRDGFIAFPRYFSAKNVRESGTELDGHAGIVISLIALWQRLPVDDPFRAALYSFLHQPASPVRYLHHQLATHPLIAGSGEFSAGDPKSLHVNVVQNHLSALALLSAAEMEEAAGDHLMAKLWRDDAKTIFDNLEKHLAAADGSWIWCVNASTLLPEPGVLNKAINAGFGGLNGVACMSSDVLGFDASAWEPKTIVSHGEKTFDDLYAVSSRKEQFEKYGFWSQFDRIHNGQLSSPSYGQGYALQTMLLFDKLDMAARGLNFLAQATFDATGLNFTPPRSSPYYFYERIYSPDAIGHGELSTGCGPLNLVNVAEPLKVARLIAGLDDTSLREVVIIPRLPVGWSGYTAKNWPVRTANGVVRASFSLEKTNGAVVFQLQVLDGQKLPKLAVRLPANKGNVWKHYQNVADIKPEATSAP